MVLGGGVVIDGLHNEYRVHVLFSSYCDFDHACLALIVCDPQAVSLYDPQAVSLYTINNIRKW
jgi:hypothetical protein